MRLFLLSTFLSSEQIGLCKVGKLARLGFHCFDLAGNITFHRLLKMADTREKRARTSKSQGPMGVKTGRNKDGNMCVVRSGATRTTYRMFPIASTHNA